METLYSTLFELVKQQPRAVAVVSPGATNVSFLELLHRISDIRTQLSHAGIERKHRVALLCPFGSETVVNLLAVACHASVIPLRPTDSVAEFEKTLCEVRADILLTSEQRHRDLEAIASSLHIPCLQLYSNLAAESEHLNLDAPSPSDIALIARTSGSTRGAKLCPITHRQLVARAVKTQRLLELNANDRCLNLMPPYYMHAINSGIVGPLLAGGSTICPTEINRATFAECLSKLDATWYTAGATHHENIIKWLEHQPIKHSLRFARSGSSALNPDTLTRLEECLGVPLCESYSSTETGTVTSNPPSWARKPGTVGVSPEQDFVVVNEHDEQLGPGQQGQVLVRGITVFSGYEGNTERNANSFKDGWFYTGDIGEVDREGYLRLRGRIDEIINRGGEKVSPQEVDQHLISHPAIDAALTFAIPHPTLNSDVACALVCRAGMQIAPGEVRGYLRERLPPHKIPRHILVTETLPTTASGKLSRKGATERFGYVAEQKDNKQTSKALPLPAVQSEARRNAGGDRLAGCSPMEETLIASWRQVIGNSEIGLDDDFFSSGGDSLSAIELSVVLEQQLQVKIPFQYLVENATPRQLARRLYLSPPTTDDVVGIQVDGKSAPLFTVCGRYGYALRLLLVGRTLGPDQPFYGLQPPGMDWQSRGLLTIPQFAEYYINEVTRIQAQGPYRLLGTSFGGLVVFEMALQLQALGHEVELLALLDTYPPDCVVDGALVPDDPLPLNEESSGQREEVARGLDVARSHVTARQAYRLDKAFDGEMIYFGVGDPGCTNIDRRRLWSFFASSVRVVHLPGRHGQFHLEPQFGALCGHLKTLLRECRQDQAATRIAPAQASVEQGSGHGEDVRREALCGDEHDPGLWLGQAKSFQALGEVDEALKSYQRAIELASDDPQMQGLLRACLLHLGSLYRQSGEPVAAIATYRKVLAIDPLHSGACTSLVNLLNQQGQHVDALQLCQQMVDLAPDDPHFRRLLGHTERQRGQLEDAISSYEKAIELAPEHTGSSCALADTLRQLGRLEESGAVCLQALQRNPDPGVYRCLGDTQQRQGDLAAAIASYQNGLDIDPRQLVIHLGLGRVYLRMGKLKEALSIYQKALEIQPDHPGANRGLGSVYLRQGDAGQAIGKMMKVIESNPSDTQAHFLLAKAQHQQGDIKAAIESYRKTLELNPEHVQAEKSLRRILQ